MEFDHIIFATGYIPNLEILKIKEYKKETTNKYPKLKKFGESSLTDNLFFGGPLAQIKLANTFIHGFVKTIPETMQEINKRLKN